MIDHAIRLALHQRWLILTAVLGLFVWGTYSFTQLPIEAYPDVMNTQVQVITQWPGHAAEEVEKLITIPLETSLNGVPRVASLRSRSLFGLSVVYLIFEDGVDDYFARQQVLERITSVNLPTNVQPGLSPLASATGEIFRYTVTGASLMDLRILQDWTLAREFKSVPGVADVNTFGGLVRQYQVIVDPNRLKAYDLTLKNVTDALSAANANSGGNFLEHGSEETVIRGLGQFRTIEEIGRVVVTARDGTPIRVGDVADVRIGAGTRLGKVGMRPGLSGADADRDDIVEGIVLLRRGENPGPVLERIHDKVAELNGSILPRGVKVVPLLDRTDLVHVTSHTVEENLIAGMLLVVAVLFLFLGNARASVITALTIPVSLLFAFSLMNSLHMSANLLSLGAVDFGILVNGSVIMVENLYRRLAGRSPEQPINRVVLSACREVQSEIFVTTAIIITAYLPLFTMQSVEKKMFAPMAFTLSFALVGSLLMALLVAPVLCSMWLRRPFEEREARWMTSLRRSYRRSLIWSLERPWLVLGLALDLLVFSLLLAPALGTEFLPHLDEGNLWIRATMPSTVSFTEAQRIVPVVRGILSNYQPVAKVISQLGRPDDGTDATGFYNAEFLVDLKPYGQWRGYTGKEALIAAMNRDLERIPGVSFNFSQNIQDNVEEAVTGIKGELAVKLFGEELDQLEGLAAKIQKALTGVRGVVDLATFTETGEPQVQIVPDRARMARYGLNISDVQDLIETAIGGRAVTQLLDGERRFDVVVRFDPLTRNSMDRIREMLISAPDGSRVPLASVADVRLTRGASFVYREANRRFIAIKFGIRGRDIGGAVQEAQSRVREQVHLPQGYRMVWGGEFESMNRAGRRLSLIIPITLLIIFLILFTMFSAVSRAAMVMLDVPLALIGGVVALYLTGYHLSVAAAVGFIALFGVAVQNGVIMVSGYDQLRERGATMEQALIDGSETRLRPILMTALLAMIGLVPAALSRGIGSDTQKPLAIVIIGGLMSATLLTLYVLPVLYSLLGKGPTPPMERRREAREDAEAVSVASTSQSANEPESDRPLDGELQPA